MSEEEIAKALNDLKELSMTNYYGDTYFTEQAGTKLALKYIDKLQNENEELKEVNKKLKEKLHEKNMRIIKLNKLLGGLMSE